MLKPALPWQTHGKKRQILTNWIALMFLLFGIFYYISWCFLEASVHRKLPATDPIQIETAVGSAVPSNLACPPPPPPPPPPANFPLPTTSPPPYDPQKLAFLVESRPLPHLPALFGHMTSIVPPEWTFKFMGSPEAITHMRSSPLIARLETAGKLIIVPIPSNYSLSSRETISRMFTDPHLYSHHLSPAEHLLVFQPDSIFCANSPITLNDFLEYDYVGAPWSKTSEFGGNGGLSLRRVSRILLALSKERRRHNDGELEDLWLSTRLKKLPGSKMANATISKQFSVESVWDDRPLGYHVGWLGVHHEQIWDDEGQVAHALSYCPEVKIILGMKLAGDKPESVRKIEEEKEEEEVRKLAEAEMLKKIQLARPQAGAGLQNVEKKDTAQDNVQSTKVDARPQKDIKIGTHPTYSVGKYQV